VSPHAFQFGHNSAELALEVALNGCGRGSMFENMLPYPEIDLINQINVANKH
jgi:hypothetical protein